MSDKMFPIPFARLMDWAMTEHDLHGSVFGVRRPFVSDDNRKLTLFGERLETPFGPAAGPHTQLAQNIIAAYYAGSRFFELKTVQAACRKHHRRMVRRRPLLRTEDRTDHGRRRAQ